MKTQKVKSTDSGRSSRPQKTPWVRQGRSDPQKVEVNKSSPNNQLFKKTTKIQDPLPVKTFLKTSLKSDVKSSVNHLFLKNFLMTKGHLGSPQWTKDMTNSLEGIRQGFAVFDGEKTKIACSRAFHFLKTYQKPSEDLNDQTSSTSLISSDPETKSRVQWKKKKLDILFVNTSEQYRHLIQKVARITGQRYIHDKWVGGTLTNWSQISQSYSLFGRFHSLFGNFLKKRKIHLPIYEKARRIYSGLLPQETRKKKPKKQKSEGNSFESKRVMTNQLTLFPEQTGDHPEESQDPSTFSESKLPQNGQIFEKSNDGLPDILFLINPEENQNVLREANLLKIPVIALTDSNTKISGIDYMIPGNVQSIKFVYWFLNCMTIILQKRNKRKKKKSITSIRKKLNEGSSQNSPLEGDREEALGKNSEEVETARPNQEKIHE